MNTKKIVTIIGARPQFIKASVVSDQIGTHKSLKEIVIHTGQHHDENMSDIFFAELGMRKPEYCLDVHGGSHGEMTGKMIQDIEKVLIQEKPDAVLVYGDTNSTLAGALAAVKLHIPIAHVEAGLRSFNMDMPEEVNRIITDRVSHWLFTPTQSAAEHLKEEGIINDRIIPVGDVMYDVALHHGGRVNSTDGLMADLNLKEHSYILATIHRAENTDHPKRLRAIVDALELVADQIPVIWPLHPRTRIVLQKLDLLDRINKKIVLLEPLGYLDMVQLEKYASVIATDSGGVQKEAFFYNVPCVTLRDETEWVELVAAGWNKLVSPVNAIEISDAILKARNGKGENIKPYGNGEAAKSIVNKLIKDFQL